MGDVRLMREVRWSPFFFMKKVTQWLSLFTNDEPSLLLRQFGESALLDVKVSDNTNFVLNGFCLDSARNPSYVLSSFSSQNPVSFNLKQYVSNRAVMVATYGISDGKAFTKDLKAFTATNRRSVDSLSKIADVYKVNLAELPTTISGERATQSPTTLSGPTPNPRR